MRKKSSENHQKIAICQESDVGYTCILLKKCDGSLESGFAATIGFVYRFIQELSMSWGLGSRISVEFNADVAGDIGASAGKDPSENGVFIQLTEPSY